MNTQTVKSTVNITKHNREQLEYLVKINELGSVTEGINIAIAEFIKAKQKEIYAEKMRSAAADADFISRTACTQSDFEKADAESLPKDTLW